MMTASLSSGWSAPVTSPSSSMPMTSSPPSALAIAESVSATSLAMSVARRRLTEAPDLSHALLRSKNCPSGCVLQSCITRLSTESPIRTAWSYDASWSQGQGRMTMSGAVMDDQPLEDVVALADVGQRPRRVVRVEADEQVDAGAPYLLPLAELVELGARCDQHLACLLYTSD